MGENKKQHFILVFSLFQFCGLLLTCLVIMFNPDLYQDAASLIIGALFVIVGIVFFGIVPIGMLIFSLICHSKIVGYTSKGLMVAFIVFEDIYCIINSGIFTVLSTILIESNLGQNHPNVLVVYMLWYWYMELAIFVLTIMLGYDYCKKVDMLNNGMIM